jgi:prevent-host-death family protein
MEAAVQLLRCSPMATDVPQRELRNRTADLLRRVEAGERLRITVHGHPVAELVPIEERVRRRTFVPLREFEEGLGGLMSADEAREWIDEIHEFRRERAPGEDPFEKYERMRAEGRLGPRPDET